MLKRCSKEEYQAIAKTATSKRDFYIKLGGSPNSGSYKSIIDNLINKYNLDVNHFTGSAWNKNIVDIDGTFKIGCKVKSERLKRALVLIRGYECEECGRTQWLGKPIPLEVHHIDGNPLNNSQDNLQLLCCNCHSLTPNYRNRKRAAE